MGKYKIIDTVIKKLNTKGRLVRASFDFNTCELILQTDRQTIASEYEPSWIHDLVEIDETFNSVQVLNKLFNNKIKKVLALPTGHFINDKKFIKDGYKCIYDKDGYIRQDIIDEIHYFFTIPYNFDIDGLNGSEVFDGIDNEPYIVLRLNGPDNTMQFFVVDDK
jgi:DNA integrity scanning protein DisA with diadenylate cyclase activity